MENENHMDKNKTKGGNVTKEDFLSRRNVFKRSAKRNIFYLIFAIPALAYVIGLAIIPAITVVYDSFIGKHGFTLANYLALPSYGLYGAIINTLLVSVGALIIASRIVAAA